MVRSSFDAKNNLQQERSQVKILRIAQLITNLSKYHFIEGDLQRKKFKSKETFLGRRSWSSG